MEHEKTSHLIDVIARDCIGLRFRLLNRVITNLFDEALRALGLKVSQLNILVATAKLGVAHPARVCDILQLDTSTLSRNVERMRAKGWLEIVPADDARTQPFRLTARGRRILERAIPAWEKAQQEAVQLLGEDGVVMLDRMTKSLACAQGGPKTEQHSSK
jgi:DNA-binding MarR family transcriptional regulator